MAIRVVIHLKAPDGDETPLHEAYRSISWVTKETPGLVGCELLRDVEEPDRFMLVSDWQTLEAFRAWQVGPDHHNNPSALRPFQDRSRGRHYGVYEQHS